MHSIPGRERPTGRFASQCWSTTKLTQKDMVFFGPLPALPIFRPPSTSLPPPDSDEISKCVRVLPLPPRIRGVGEPSNEEGPESLLRSAPLSLTCLLVLVLPLPLEFTLDMELSRGWYGVSRSTSILQPWTAHKACFCFWLGWIAQRQKNGFGPGSAPPLLHLLTYKYVVQGSVQQKQLQSPTGFLAGSQDKQVL